MFLRVTTIIFFLALGISQFKAYSYSSLIIGITALIIAVAMTVGDSFSNKN